MTFSTIYDAFAAQFENRPSTEAIVFPDLTFSYAQLSRLVNTFISKLKTEHDVNSGSVLMLQSSEVATVVSFYLAASALGAAIVEQNDDLVVPHGASLTHYFFTGAVKDQYPTGSIRIDQSWSPSQHPDVQYSKIEIDPSTPYLYNFSSGTTGLAKIIPLSHRTIVGRALAANYDFKGGETRFATLLPVGTRPFLIRVMAALANGSTIVDGTDEYFWLDNRVNFVSGSVRQMTAKFDRAPLAPKIKEAEVIGARLSIAVANRLLQSFEMVQDAIGASESSKFYINRHSLIDGRHLVTGEKLDSEIEILDVISGAPTKTEEGSLRVRNSYLAGSYDNDLQTAAQNFRDGWFYTGDTARWGQNGVLDVSERTNNVINIAGNKIHGALIDRVLSSGRNIRDAIAFKNPKPGAPDEVFAFVIFEEGANQLQAIEVAKLRVEELLGSAFVPRVIRGVAGLPRLADGSADRKACANFILDLANSKLKAES